MQVIYAFYFISSVRLITFFLVLSLSHIYYLKLKRGKRKINRIEQTILVCTPEARKKLKHNA